MVSLIVYKLKGKYQSVFDVGKEPPIPMTALHIFTVRVDNKETIDETMNEVNRLAVEKAEVMKLGKVAGLPDKSELEKG